MKGHCPTCLDLVEIHCTGEPMEWRTIPGGSMPLPIGSSMWKLVCLHPDKTKEPDSEGRYPICAGSGKRI